MTSESSIFWKRDKVMVPAGMNHQTWRRAQLATHLKHPNV